MDSYHTADSGGDEAQECDGDRKWKLELNLYVAESSSAQGLDGRSNAAQNFV